MNAGRYVLAFAALAAPVVAENHERIELSCIVNSAGLLEAEVISTSDFAQTCSLRCDYVVGESAISHRFEISIAPRFKGIVGQMDTARGRPGRYSGRIDSCQKLPST